MKYLITLCLALTITACGDSGGDSAANEINLRQECEFDSVYAGEWQDSSLNELNINDDCTGRDDYCQASFTYYKPVNGQVLIDIESTLGYSDCLEVGEHTCSISHDTDDSNEYLTINCGGGDTVYVPR